MLVSLQRTYAQTGVTTYYLILRDEYRKRGHDVTVVTTEATPGLFYFFVRLNRKVLHPLLPQNIRLWWNEREDFLSIYLAVRRVRRAKAWDIIHGQDPNSSCAAVLATGGRTPVVTTCHFSDSPVRERCDGSNMSRRQVQKVTDWFTYLCSKVRHYIYVSDYVYRQSRDLLTEPYSHTVIPNGVVFGPRTTRVRSGTLHITNIGRLETGKNQILLILAAQHLLARGFDFHIHFLGTGHAMEEWKTKVEAWGLSAVITFHGFRDDRLEFLKASDLYIHTSLKENSSFAIMEAIAAGVPVFALDVGGVPEQLPSSRAGLLDPGISPEDLADKIVGIAAPERLQALQLAQYGHAWPGFTIDSMIENTLSYYGGLHPRPVT
jgi:glycosyltransferase involved in cell wall biosynthesis